jgi:hypothetical protein
MRKILFTILLVLPLVAVSQPRANSDPNNEVYDFQIDKSVAKERALKDFGFDMVAFGRDFNIEQLFFSSIKGKECEGKPARYIMVLADSLKIQGFHKYAIYNVSNPNKWTTLTIGATHNSLPSLISQLRVGMCGG